MFKKRQIGMGRQGGWSTRGQFQSGGQGLQVRAVPCTLLPALDASTYSAFHTHTLTCTDTRTPEYPREVSDTPNRPHSHRSGVKLLFTRNKVRVDGLNHRQGELEGAGSWTLPMKHCPQESSPTPCLHPSTGTRRSPKKPSHCKERPQHKCLAGALSVPKQRSSQHPLPSWRAWHRMPSASS